MKQLTKIYTFIFLSLASAKTEAIYNPHQGSLELDLQSDLNLRLPFSLRYSSRSLYLGYFGRGWCSFVDVKLTKSLNGYQLEICEDRIDLSSDQIQDLNNKLLVQHKQNTYHFDKQTLKREFTSAEQQFLKQTVIAKDSNELLLELRFSPKEKVLLEYNNFDNLTSISNQGRELATFTYDDDLDLLKTVHQGKNCQIHITYELKSPLRFITKAVHRCRQQSFSQVFDFVHGYQANGDLLLLAKNESKFSVGGLK
ncbi:MAG: hypothetical protein ACLGGX_04975 [Bdellovibrionia bacterium]